MGMLEEVALAITNPIAPISTSYGALLTSPTVGNVAVGMMPSDPDECIALLEPPGRPPVETMTPLPSAENQTLLVQVRSVSFPTGQNTIKALWLDLHRLVEVTLSGTRWHVCQSIQSPYLSERDDKKRMIFSCTFHVVRRVG